MKIRYFNDKDSVGIKVSIKDFCRFLFEKKACTEKQSRTLEWKMNQFALDYWYKSVKKGYFTNAQSLLIFSKNDFFACWTFFSHSYKIANDKIKNNQIFHELNRLLDSPQDIRFQLDIFQLIEYKLSDKQSVIPEKELWDGDKRKYFKYKLS